MDSKYFSKPITPSVTNDKNINKIDESGAFITSTIVFTGGFLSLKVFIVLWTAILLRLFNIPFNYSLFKINYLPVDSPFWIRVSIGFLIYVAVLFSGNTMTILFLRLAFESKYNSKLQESKRFFFLIALMPALAGLLLLSLLEIPNVNAYEKIILISFFPVLLLMYYRIPKFFVVKPYKINRKYIDPKIHLWILLAGLIIIKALSFISI